MPTGTQRTAFRTANGSYLCAEGGGVGWIVANRPGVGPWETFLIHWLTDDTIAIQVFDGHWVEVVGDRLYGSGETNDSMHARFRIIWHGDDRISLQAGNGAYVCAEGGGGGKDVLANRHAIGDWEKFWLEVPPDS
jgi:hypothetical protein